MKHVVLFGGSFNPAHIGHFEMAKYISQTLDIDEVWFLFSQNIDKDPAIYAPLEHRIAMAEILNKQYQNYSFVMSDAEYKTGTHITPYVLPKIEEMYPDHKFIWAMGADNLEHFHLWENYEKIIEHYPILILNRSGSDYRRYPAFEGYDSHMCRDPKRLLKQKNGIHFLGNPYIDISSTEIRDSLKKRHNIFDENFQNVYDYISEQNLYK